MDIWFMSDETPVVNGDKSKIKQLEDEISGHESDKRALSSIAARASELETQEANAEVSNLNLKDVEKEEKMNVIENEGNLLLEKLKESEERFLEFQTEKARKFELLMNEISEFEAKEREKSEKIDTLMDKLKESEEKLKEFESKKTRKIEFLMNQISEFETKESEKEERIRELESEGIIKDDKIKELKFKNMKVNEMEEKIDQLQKEIVSKENVVETTTTNNGIVSKVDWPVVAVSAGAVATLGLVYFRHAKF